MTRQLQIGDVVALGPDYDPEARLQVKRSRLRFQQQVAKGEGGNQAVRAARLAIAESKKAEDRLRDPLEQAKTYLRSRGYIPVATIDGKHIVGRTRQFQTDAELFKFAASKGWGVSKPVAEDTSGHPEP